jgi:hypothetical protein
LRSLVPLIVVALGVSACLSDYRSKYKLPQDCDRQVFFEDLDEDGWGDPDGAAAELCEADPGAMLTARNNLDCDDDNPEITGLIASICPERLVVGGAEFLGMQEVGSEFAAVLPTADFSHVNDTGIETTALTFAAGAASACGATGWGGGLATFNDLTEFGSVTDRLDAVVGDSYYAAWIGLVPSGTSWKWADAEPGAGMQVDEVGFCDSLNAPKPDGPDAGVRLALVKPEGGEWCLGFPSDANPDDLAEGELEYGARAAYSLCERVPPLASEYPVDLLPAE